MATQNPVLAQAQKIQKREPIITTQTTDVSAAPEEFASTSQTTKTSTVETTTIDSPAAITFESAMDAINVGLEESARLTQESVEVSRAQKGIANKATEVVMTSIKDKQTIAKVEAAAEMNSQLKGKEVFEALGGTEELTRLATLRKEAQQKVLDTQAAVAENVDVQFSDDPLQFIVNKFTLADTMEEANVASASLTKIDNAISNITALASNADRAISDVEVNITKASLAANQRLIAQQATIDAAKFEMQAQEANAAEIAAVMGQSRAEMTSRVDQYKLGLMARSEQEQQIDRELRRKKLKEDSSFEDTFVKGVVAGRKRTGVPIYEGSDPTLIKEQRDRILTEHRLGGEQQARVSKQYEVGVGTVSPTPFQTLEAFSVSDPTRLTDGSNVALEALADSTATATQALTDAGAKVTKDNLESATNKQFEADMISFEKVIKGGDATNPNRAAPMAVLLESAPVRDLPLVTNVLAPLITDDVKDLKESKVIELAVASIRTKANPEGTITFNDAWEGLVTIYSQAVDYNNTSQNRAKLGLPLQKRYNVKFSKRIEPHGKFLGFLPAGVSFSDTVDLTDETAVKQALLFALTNIKLTKTPDIFLNQGDVNRAQEK